MWRCLAWGLAAVTAFSLVGCSSGGGGDDGTGSRGGGSESEDGITTETGSGKQFCVAAAELASAIQAESWIPGVAIERAFPRTLQGLDDLASSAPEGIGQGADNLRSGLERFYSILDEVPAVGDPPDPALVQQAQETLQRAGQAQADAAVTFQEVNSFVEEDCPGTSLPTITVPTNAIPTNAVPSSTTSAPSPSG
jgi:hypothetical protein